jgi:hypothetical protein
MTKVEVPVASTGVERVTACSWRGIGFGVTEHPKTGAFRGFGAGQNAGRNLASNECRYSNLRKVACAIRDGLLPFKSRFSPFGPLVFLDCHRQSSLMLKEYRLPPRGILDWYRRSRVVVD